MVYEALCYATIMSADLTVFFVSAIHDVFVVIRSGQHGTKSGHIQPGYKKYNHAALILRCTDT